MAKVEKPDCIQSVKDYITKMVTDVSGMKVMVLDKETTGIVSMVYTQTQILQQEVFLIDSLEQEKTEKMPHLKALYFVRSTRENISKICQELRDPKYGEYHIFFSNLTRDTHIQQLAEADEHEVVQQVQEYFGDFFAVNSDLFSLAQPKIAGLMGTNWDQPVFDRMCQGITSVLLALKKRPCVRFQHNSELAMRCAETVSGLVEAEGDLFSFRSRTEVPPLLLVLDRKDDPVTPLLNQWTYQAMVHELITISNNRVDMKNAPGIKDDMKQIVLSVEHDPFYLSNMFSNFGDLGANVKDMVDDFQKKTHSNKQVNTIEEMQAFVENYPEFRKLSGNVTKHVTLMGELSRLVDAGSLMDVSQVEQELACTEDHSSAVQEVESLLLNTKVSTANKLRLVLLYALRYENNDSNQINHFIDMLQGQGVPHDKLKIVNILLSNFGSTQRQGDLFSNKSFFAVAKKSIQRGVKGVQNVYTQHQPYLAQTLETLLKGKLRDAHYPYIGNYQPPAPSSAGLGSVATSPVPSDIIIFMVGGATYEEAKCVWEFNQQYPSTRIVLGGSTILNSKMFLDDVAQMVPLTDNGTQANRMSDMLNTDPREMANNLTSSLSSMTNNMQAGFSSISKKM